MSDDRWPVSVKGVFGPSGHVVLLHNERDEWELPGGRLELTDDSSRAALAREIDEELGLEVTVAEAPARTWIYEPLPGRKVLIVTYACRLVGEWPPELTHSDEHDDVCAWPIGRLDELSLPDGYREDIRYVMG